MNIGQIFKGIIQGIKALVADFLYPVRKDHIDTHYSAVFGLSNVYAYIVL